MVLGLIKYLESKKKFEELLPGAPICELAKKGEISNDPTLLPRLLEKLLQNQDPKKICIPFSLIFVATNGAVAIRNNLGNFLKK